VVNTRKSRAVVGVVLGVVVILGYVVWTWARSSTPGATAGALATATATSQGVDPETRLRWVDVADLPPQGRSVLALIDRGGPFPYSQDGGTFSNAEKLLPLKANGFYTEYTVKLPGSSDRGPVRIIMGGKGQWYFWTQDHYASFERIRR
jgi:ribonuclease T1